MATDSLQALPTDVLDRITDLVVNDNHTQGKPELTADNLPWAFTYLDRLLLGGFVLDRHLTHLGKVYDATFRRFASRRDRTEEDPAIPGGPDMRFRHHAFLSTNQASAILERGPDALHDRSRFPEGEGIEMARLLLNPYALWDLTDLVDSLLPDYWLNRMTEYGQELATEVGIELMPGTPLMEKPTEKEG